MTIIIRKSVRPGDKLQWLSGKWYWYIEDGNMRTSYYTAYTYKQAERRAHKFAAKKKAANAQNKSIEIEVN